MCKEVLHVILNHFHDHFRLYHCHNILKCQFENARSEGYCQKISHADECEPVTEMALVQRQCYTAIKNLSIKHPSMTAKQIKDQTILEEKDSLLRVVNQNRRPSDPLINLPDNAESLLGNNQKVISRNIYNIKDGLNFYQNFILPHRLTIWTV